MTEARTGASDLGPSEAPGLPISGYSGASRATLGLIGLALVLLGLVPFLSPGRLMLVATSVAGVAVAALLYQAISAAAPALLLPRLVALTYALQILSVLLVALLDLPTTLPQNRLAPDISLYPLGSVMPLLLVPLGTLLATGLVSLLAPVRRAEPALLELLRTRSAGIPAFLTACAILKLLYWIAGPETGFFGYMVRVVEHSLFFAPFIAGAVWQRFRNVDRMWVFVLIVNGIIGFLAASRERAFAPLGLYILGLIVSMRGPRRVWAALAAICIAVPAILAAGILGVIRTELGRGTETIGTRRLGELYDSAVGLAQDQSRDAWQEVGWQGLGRLAAWPNIVVTLLSPSPIPYRGLDDLGQEVVSYARISALSGDTADDILEEGLSTGPATLYGFTVNSSTSVEFGILADGWSRGGPAVALIFGFILALVLAGMELFVLAAWLRSPVAGAFLLCPWAKSALFATVYPLMSLLRSGLLLTLLYLTVALALACFYWRRQVLFGGRSTPSSPGPRHSGVEAPPQPR